MAMLSRVCPKVIYNKFFWSNSSEYQNWNPCAVQLSCHHSKDSIEIFCQNESLLAASSENISGDYSSSAFYLDF